MKRDVIFLRRKKIYLRNKTLRHNIQNCENTISVLGSPIKKKMEF